MSSEGDSEAAESKQGGIEKERVKRKGTDIRRRCQIKRKEVNKSERACKEKLKRITK